MAELTKMKSYRELEILVAQIQKQLAPNAEIFHNVKFIGLRSKRKRQIDVLVTQQIGQYPIQIVIECKDYKAPVDVKGVEEFSGLLEDVAAQRSVMVCPAGFTAAAKTRAADKQIDLYSPVDTDPHKWQASPTIPAICDYRTAALAIGLRVSAPFPFETTMDYYITNTILDSDGKELGTPASMAIDKWNDGKYPIEEGEHRDLPIFETPNVRMDNGHGMKVPVTLTVNLYVTRRIFFGQ
jgi:hypothetical protein